MIFLLKTVKKTNICFLFQNIYFIRRLPFVKIVPISNIEKGKHSHFAIGTILHRYAIDFDAL